MVRRLPALVASVGLVAALAITPQPLAPAAACGDEVEEAVALLQTGGRHLRRAPAASGAAAGGAAAAQALPVLRPWGHSYFSTDPQASADYFARYFSKSRLLASDGGPSASCGGQAAHVLYCPREGESCMVLTFVKDTTKPFGQLHPAQIANVSDTEWSRVAGHSMRHVSSYSPWVDFHDGWRGEDFDSERALQDNLSFELYGQDVLRLGLPGTMWTIELHSHDPKLRAVSVVESPDLCRSTYFDVYVAREAALDWRGNGWWKATFGARDPVAAAEFAVRALGAIKVQGPFPDPPQEDCIFVQWVVLPDGLQGVFPGRPSGFMLHFVREPKSAWERGNVTIETFAKMQEELRDLEAGVFDAYMYNSLILWADTLDPYVERFRSLNVPFLPLQVAEGTFAVFVDVPGNGIPLQLRSEVLTVATPRAADNICW